MRGTCFWEANGRRMTVSWWEEVQPPQRMEENTGGNVSGSPAARAGNLLQSSHLARGEGGGHGQLLTVPGPDEGRLGGVEQLRGGEDGEQEKKSFVNSFVIK